MEKKEYEAHKAQIDNSRPNFPERHMSSPPPRPLRPQPLPTVPKEEENHETRNALLRYGILLTALVVFISGTFWLGAYYSCSSADGYLIGLQCYGFRVVDVISVNDLRPDGPVLIPADQLNITATNPYAVAE